LYCSIGWNHSLVDVLISVEQFENERFLQRLPSSQDLVLPRAAREALLSAWGVSHAEMVKAVRRNVKVKNQRRQTANNIGRYDRVEEMVETTTRQMKMSFQFRLLNSGKGGGASKSINSLGQSDNGTRNSNGSSRSSGSNEKSVREANDLKNKNTNMKAVVLGLVPPTTRIDLPATKPTLLSGPELPVIELKRSLSAESALTDANWSQYVSKDYDVDSCEQEEEDVVSESDMEDFEEEDFTISNLTNFEEEDDATLPTKFLNAYDDFCLNHMQELDESHPKLLRRADMERPGTSCTINPTKTNSPRGLPKRGPETTPEPLEMESPCPRLTKDKALLLQIYVPPQGSADPSRCPVGQPLPIDCKVGGL
jgi:hypothetical protein